MNLMMHNIEYNDIQIHHADTLESDWPDGVIEGKDTPRMFDAVMANPPYSAHWNNKDREDDLDFVNMALRQKLKRTILSCCIVCTIPKRVAAWPLSSHTGSCLEALRKDGFEKL